MVVTNCEEVLSGAYTQTMYFENYNVIKMRKMIELCHSLIGLFVSVKVIDKLVKRVGILSSTLRLCSQGMW